MTPPSPSTSSAPPSARVDIDLAVVFGKLLRALRARRGASQDQLAAALRWDRGLLSRIEAGRNTPTINELFEVDRLFRQSGDLVQPGQLLGLVQQVLEAVEEVGLRPELLPRRNTPEMSAEDDALVEDAVALVVAGLAR